MPEPPRDGRDRCDVGFHRAGVGEDLLDPLDAHAPVLGDLRDGHSVGGLPGDLGVLPRRDVRGAQVEHPLARPVRPGCHRFRTAPDRPAVRHRLPQVLLVPEPFQPYLRPLPDAVELVQQHAQTVGPYAIGLHAGSPRGHTYAEANGRPSRGATDFRVRRPPCVRSAPTGPQIRSSDLWSTCCIEPFKVTFSPLTFELGALWV